MKKLIIGVLTIALGVSVFAAETYQVYKFQLKAKTTDAKGVASACGCDEFCYREKRAVTLQGILAGCGCGAIEANGVCKNAIVYMWDATRGIAITNVEMTIPWTVQRVGKKLNVVEHFAAFKATYGDNDQYTCEFTMSGFGTYKDNTKDCDLSYVSGIDGNFSGLAGAPYYVKYGKCTACSVEPDQEFQSTAFALCESCSEGLSEAANADVTPFFGAYSVRYDSGKSKACSKNGLSQKNLGLPSYVSVTDYIATNIGE